ncbi:MAG: hypothetical protein U0X75_08040 [Acidobacteriota bacterium]
MNWRSDHHRQFDFAVGLHDVRTITIPTNAQAVVGNVTVINQGGQSGFLTLHPNGVPLPLAANMIYGPGQIPWPTISPLSVWERMGSLTSSASG